MINALLLLGNVFLMTAGQVLFKQGAKSLSGLSVSNLIPVVTNVYLLSGIFVYACSTVLWVYVLSRMNLSLAYPTQSLSYIFVMIASYLIFREPVSMAQWAGIALVLAGVVFIAQG
ncbi:EamA family transporter [Cohnella candidum]|uniref:EamA domain-containing protein n=1 Tax=Cohnella candidum TaxID=2674991 RepID=A0A3G3K308_9BACL|nr:EamA family transporter [Cohnella candidum]AYQ74159.1 hypothetical protein EAV92_17265 [Cohnella candidum]